MTQQETKDMLLRVAAHFKTPLVEVLQDLLVRSLLATLVTGARPAELLAPAQYALFLSQLHYESGGFRYLHEIWGPTPTQERYEGREDLGNTEPGDGYKYRGRGYIMLTGRANYTKYANLLGRDLLNAPHDASIPLVAFQIAHEFFKQNKLYDLVFDALHPHDYVLKATKIINGGTNGYNQRAILFDQYYRVITTG